MLILTLNQQKSGYYPLATLMVKKTIKVKNEKSSKGTPLPFNVYNPFKPSTRDIKVTKRLMLKF
jgi:hypothetical protein